MFEDNCSDFECLICREEGTDPLLYTSCGHRLCKKCRDKLFGQAADKLTIPCPFCKQQIKKKDITTRSPEELAFEHEMHIRNTLKIEMNEKLEDFPSVEQYYDFLELFEDLGSRRSPVAKKLRDPKFNDNEDINAYRLQKLDRKRTNENNQKKKAAVSFGAPR